MRILVTNDDGINAEGIKILVDVAKKYGEVICIAPFSEQSGKSQCIVVKTPYKISKVEPISEGVLTYAVDSTPADCVRMAHYYLKLDFDLVLTGINNGYNLGEDILYSGTIGAASEGILCGKKAIAFSGPRNNFEGLKENIDMMIKYVMDNKLLDKCNLWNINICDNPKGIKFASQGSTHFDSYYDEVGNDMVLSKGAPDFAREKDKINSDVWNIYNHYITITPLVVDRTNFNVLNKFNN